MNEFEVKELTQINENEGVVLKKVFMPFFEEAEKIKIEAEKIKITSADQKEDMKKAKEIRLKLKEIRINAEKTRKDLKEESLRKGKAIDGMANIIKFLVEPVENYLENQEKFVENLEKHRKLELKNKRTLALSTINIIDVESLNLGEMQEDVFASFFSAKKQQFEDLKIAEEKAEIERIEKEKQRLAEEMRLKVENDKLKAEIEEKERILQIERAEQLKKEAELQAKIKAETDEKNRLEKERLQKELEEKNERDRIERERIEKIEAEKQKGEKEKFLDFCNFLDNLKLPEVISDKGTKVNISIKNSINTLVANIKKSI